MNTESYILCEGYHDRAFWKGILLALGCASMGIPGTTPNDPWGDPVRGGQFAFLGKRKGFIRVVPAGSKNNLLRLAIIRLQQRADRPLRHLIINADSDANADGTPRLHGELQCDTIFDQVCKAIDPHAIKSAAHEISIDQGACRLLLFPWRSDHSPAAGLPNQQTLERLVCSALASAYPERPVPVDQWLKSRPSPPKPNPKEHAFSYLAGWYAHTGSYEGFCENLWNDPQIAAQLRGQLERQGVWPLLEEIAEIH
jgi:hypothetical protein